MAAGVRRVYSLSDFGYYHAGTTVFFWAAVNAHGRAHPSAPTREDIGSSPRTAAGLGCRQPPTYRTETRPDAMINLRLRPDGPEQVGRITGLRPPSSTSRTLPALRSAGPAVQYGSSTACLPATKDRDLRWALREARRSGASEQSVRGLPRHVLFRWLLDESQEQRWGRFAPSSHSPVSSPDDRQQ